MVESLQKKFSVPQSSISDALVLGKHGDFLVPIFSNADVDGKSLLSLIDNDEKKSMTSDIRNYWRELRNYKSRSQFGITKNAFDVINAIVHGKEIPISASVVLEGEYGEMMLQWALQ